MKEMSDIQDINIWRQAHLRLTLAIAQSRDNISKELTIRRYLLEEITRCKTFSAVSLPKKTAEGGKAKKKPMPKPKDDKDSKSSTGKDDKNSVKKVLHKKVIISKSKVDTSKPKLITTAKAPVKPKPLPMSKPNPVSSEAAKALISMAQAIGGGSKVNVVTRDLDKIIGTNNNSEQNKVAQGLDVHKSNLDK